MFTTPTDPSDIALSRRAAARYAVLTALAERRADDRRLRRTRSTRATRPRI
jgi:hypothetical protein